ncbi:MAG: hypothetical protein JNL12_15915 [Planctomycetes bacterium]|nr:hypothetical protein [Planctomycetota bacterium]
MKRIEPLRLLSLATLAALAACSGSGSGSATTTTGDTRTGSDFLVFKTDPVNGGAVFLNDPIAIDFSSEVDLDSASLLSMNFQALDQLGNPVTELVTGTFLISKRPGDENPGRRLLFLPRLASNNTYDNGGLRSGRSYLVQLVGGSGANTVLRSRAGKPLAQPVTFTFTTREGTQPAQLFRNPRSGGPTRTGFEVSNAADLNNVHLGLFGNPPLEVRLHFDQALNPNDTNIPVNLDTSPLVRNPLNRGNIFLEYDDPERGLGTWIPADVEIERNDLTGSTVVLRPLGVLPNNAEIRVIVEASVEDVAGESNLGQPSYNRVFASFRTEADYQQRWNGLVEDFRSSDSIDFGATFPEGQAEYGPGYLRAGFAFEGNGTDSSYRPTSAEVVLNTSFTQIVPEAGLPFSVSGGVFNFKNVTIPQGVTVIGTGPNPMVWLCSGNFTVAGTLTVRGGAGARVDTLNSANFAKAGGVAGPGGGNGGDGTPLAGQRDARGGAGRGPLQAAGKGGRGGYLACVSGCYTGSGYNGSGGGSGGGGGTFATQGDPNWRGTITGGGNPNVPPTANTRFQQRFGYGGSGCSGGAGTRMGTGILNGGEPGDLVFTDARSDNNFWGSAINLNRNLRITGELTVPAGGGGGGGGGDTSSNFNCTAFGGDPTNDYSGGGGGGGGGVVIVKALGEITITASGNINANGGNGGGGEQVGACGEAGGGGGGAGGLVVLMSATRIVIEAHGSATGNRYVYGSPSTTSTTEFPFLGNDYSFAISADGGLTTTGDFSTPFISAKYPFTSGGTMLSGDEYDSNPTGGLGGMGVVQLMVPPGENLTDGTNTRLDDNIVFRLPNSSVDLTGRQKEQLLAWRGFPNAAGQLVSDGNVALNIGSNEGDIRPSPILMPVPFSAKTRARSKWIDTGASQRRQVTAADGFPRGLDTSSGALTGPRYEFAGLDLANASPGYVSYTSLGSGGVRIDYPVAVPATPIASLTAGATFMGQQAYRLTLASGSLEPNRYVQYEAELLSATNDVLASYRIMSHDARELLLDLGEDLLPTTATQARIVAKFFKVLTDGAEGLGGVRQSIPVGGGAAVAIPISNVRIGFALHHDPKLTAGRFPTSQQDFLYDFNSPAFLAWLNNTNPNVNPLPGVMPRYIQWDVTFDMAYQPDSSPANGLTPATPRPELQFLRVPFRF